MHNRSRINASILVMMALVMPVPGFGNNPPVSVAALGPPLFDESRHAVLDFDISQSDRSSELVSRHRFGPPTDGQQAPPSMLSLIQSIVADAAPSRGDPAPPYDAGSPMSWVADGPIKGLTGSETNNALLDLVSRSPGLGRNGEGRRVCAVEEICPELSPRVILEAIEGTINISVDTALGLLRATSDWPAEGASQNVLRLADSVAAAAFRPAVQDPSVSSPSNPGQILRLPTKDANSTDSWMALGPIDTAGLNRTAGEMRTEVRALGTSSSLPGPFLDTSHTVEPLPPALHSLISRYEILQAVAFGITRLNQEDGAALLYGMPGALSMDGIQQMHYAIAASIIQILPELHGLRFAIPNIAVCGGLALDLEGVDSVYTCDHRLILDIGGNDKYLNNAGGGYGGAALLIDLAGDDIYTSNSTNPVARTGGGMVGIGTLIDVSGNDQYHASTTAAGAINGGGYLGSGLLVDLSGADSYTGVAGGSGGLNGGGVAGGRGALFDAQGDDGYHGQAYDGGANGGSAVGVGALIDWRGNDSYTGHLLHSGGLNGGSAAGIGFLLDGEGGDRYEGTIGELGAVNGAGYSDGRGALVDLNGDDTYWATVLREGAVNGGATAGVGLLLDAQGADHYQGEVGRGAVNGAAVNEAALLMDGGGDDTYIAVVHDIGAAHGAAFGGGIGILIDESGNDTYSALIRGPYGAANGGAREGVGILVDRAGDDHYSGELMTGGVNGGSYLGVGFLADEGGNDTYSARASTAGANGGTFEGIGILIDRGGIDYYEGYVDKGGINGGAMLGFALLLDQSGSDVYQGFVATNGGANGGSFGGVALLVDASGNDTFQGAIGDTGGMNGGSAGGSAILYDGGGSDFYKGSVVVGGVNGATDVGLGILWDEGGNNVFEGRAGGPFGATNGAAAGFALLAGVQDVGDEQFEFAIPLVSGLGLLRTGTGNDTYWSAGGVAQGASSSLGGTGILVDHGGHNWYLATNKSFAQGAGSAYGVGILVDSGVATQIALEDGSRGQGFGDQGTGILLRMGIGGSTSYRVSEDSNAMDSRGAGIGLVMDQGLTLGPLPSLPCPNSPAYMEMQYPPADLLDFLPGFLEPDGTVRLCYPTGSEAHPLLSEHLGPQAGTAQKPPIGCKDDPIRGLICEHVLEPILGAGAVSWMEADEVEITIIGGLNHFSSYAPSENGYAWHSFTRITMFSADSTCEMYCGVVGSPPLPASNSPGVWGG